jgi:3-hydroxyisobutyrate dehydrogenase-like beta-hydroxyacid dehydrogenase
MISVTDDAAVEQVMFGPDGALAGLREGSRIIDLSTVSPGSSRRLYNAAREKRAAMIDAAVSGSVPQVDEGNLVIFVGGDQETYQQCRPILEVLGQHIFYMGSSGMGTSMKLVVNTLLGLGMQALAEAIALGSKAGIEKNLLLEVLGQTAVMSASQKSKLANAKSDQYSTLFALSLMHKDLGLVIRQAAEISVAMPATAAAEQMYTAAMALEGGGKPPHSEGDQDFSVVIRFMQKMAGVR